MKYNNILISTRGEHRPYQITRLTNLLRHASILLQDRNGKFYARESHKDTEWKIYDRTNRDTQLICINTTKKYQPTKHSIPVQIHTSAGGKIYRKLGAELKIDKELPEGPAELFEFQQC